MSARTRPPPRRPPAAARAPGRKGAAWGPNPAARWRFPSYRGRSPADSARGPAAVAPRRPKARHLGLEHHHAQIRLKPLEVIGAPQSGEAGADDGGVAVEVAGQPSARGQRLGHLVEPEAACAVPGFEAGALPLRRDN